MNFWQVYLIKNRETGREYVGRTQSTIRARFLQHARNSIATPLTADIHEFGHDAFILERLHQSDHPGHSQWLEAFEIYRRFPDCYNTSKPLADETLFRRGLRYFDFGLSPPLEVCCPTCRGTGKIMQALGLERETIYYKAAQ